MKRAAPKRAAPKRAAAKRPAPTLRARSREKRLTPREWGWVVNAWLTILGLAATAAGGYDALKGNALNVRFLGLLVLGAGLVLLAGAVGLCGGRPPGRALALVAGYVGIALGLLLCLTQFANDVPDERLLLWAAVSVFSALAVYQIRREDRAHDRDESFWAQLPVLKSAVSMGILVSIGQFWYASVYLPASSPAAATIETKIDSAIEREGAFVVRGRVTVRNVSDAKINVLASSVELTAARGSVRVADDATWQERIREADSDVAVNKLASKFQKLDRFSRVYHQRMLPTGSFLEPGEVMTSSVLTRIPRGQYNEVVIYGYLSVARGTVLGLDRSKESSTGAEASVVDDDVVVVTPVPEDGVLQRLTRDKRYVRATYESDPYSLSFYPRVQFTSGSGTASSTDVNSRLHDFYGAGFFAAQAAYPLPKIESSR